MRYLRFPLVAAAMLALTACATLVHGTTQQIGFSSSPARATITVDGQERGLTPVVADLDRGKDHVVRIEREGYQPFEATVTRSLSGWILENLLIGSIPAIVDIATGAMWNLKPDLVTAQLVRPSSSSALATPNGIHVTLRKLVDSSLTRTGTPQRR